MKAVSTRADQLRAENERLKQQVATLEQNYSQLECDYAGVQRRYAQSERENELLREELARERSRFFGRSSEKLSDAERTQGRLFDEAEVAAAGEDTEQDEPRTPVKGHARRRPRRQRVAEDVPREEVIIDIDEADKQCACGAELVRIGEETAEKVEFIPARKVVKRYRRPKYACKQCEGAGDEDKPAVRVAPMPPAIIPKGLATASLLSCIITAKFCDAIPLYRQEKQFARVGIEIPRQTMADWMLRVAAACEPLVQQLWIAARAGPVMQMDETSVQVMHEPERANTAGSWMWVTRGGVPEAPVILYHYATSRATTVARDLIGGFEGYFQTDGIELYDRAVADNEQVVHVGCWSHARRKFHDAARASKKRGAAQQAIAYIARIYQVESERETFADAEAFAAARREQLATPLAEFHDWLTTKHDQVAPQSLLGKAVGYTLSQWPKLMRYLDDPVLGPDTNPTERAIRPFVIGRKNWLLAGSPRGAQASAALYSLVETARANGHEPMFYLWWMLDRLPQAQSADDYRALLPTRVSPRDL